MIWFLIGYILCAFLSYGMLFAYVQGNFPRIAEQQYSEDIGNMYSFWAILWNAGANWRHHLFLDDWFCETWF